MMVSDIYFVVGSGGFVGRSVKAQLLRQHEEQSLFPSRLSALADLHATIANHRDRRLLVLDLAWPGLTGVTSMNLSAPENEAEWAKYLSWLKNLMLSLKTHPDFRYFGVGSGIERYSRLGAELVDEPYLTYARRKDFVKVLAQTELPESACWLRLHYVFGPHEAPTRLVPAALTACRLGRPLALNAPERKRRWTYVDDAAQGLIGAMRQDRPEDWDIVGAEAVSIREICELVERQVGRPLLLEQSRPTADSRCLSVEPSNPAPFLPAAIGSLGQLASRIAIYDAWIKAHESDG